MVIFRNDLPIGIFTMSGTCHVRTYWSRASIASWSIISVARSSASCASWVTGTPHLGQKPQLSRSSGRVNPQKQSRGGNIAFIVFLLCFSASWYSKSSLRVIIWVNIENLSQWIFYCLLGMNTSRIEEGGYRYLSALWGAESRCIRGWFTLLLASRDSLWWWYISVSIPSESVRDRAHYRWYHVRPVCHLLKEWEHWDHIHVRVFPYRNPVPWWISFRGVTRSGVIFFWFVSLSHQRYEWGGVLTEAWISGYEHLRCFFPVPEMLELLDLSEIKGIHEALCWVESSESWFYSFIDEAIVFEWGFESSYRRGVRSFS